MQNHETGLKPMWLCSQTAMDSDQNLSPVESPKHTDEVLFNRGKSEQTANVPNTFTRRNKNSDLECSVYFLDGTNQTFYLPKNATASKLLEYAFAHIGLNDEREYFALQMINKIKIWLDPTKFLKKQVFGSPPHIFYMRVKFFSVNPHQLRDDYARYLFVLQLREEMLLGKLQCPDDQVAAQLAALLLQGELGNFEKDVHTPEFISTFRFLPEERHTEMFDIAIQQEYANLARRNLTPSETDRLYLEKVRSLPDYGVDMHKVQGKDRKVYYLGLTPTGILVYEGSNKIGLFIWSKILKLEMKGKKLKLVVADEDETNRKVVEYTFVFVLPDATACKHLWKSAIEQHTFFRLRDTVKPPTKLQQFFRLKSRFYTSFRPEFQLQQENKFGSSSFRRRNTSTGQSLRSDIGSKASAVGRSNTTVVAGDGASFRRVPSRRYAARASFSAPVNSRRFAPPSPLRMQPPAEGIQHSPVVVNPLPPSNRSPQIVAQPVTSVGSSTHRPPSQRRLANYPRPVVEDHRAHSPLSLPKGYVEYTV
uniref:Band 4.1-like protein 5 n=1 Tax=Schistocephalus solidus TaxID=70667 RepID=A0A0X3PBQ8_SCHSO